jgi:hypothetical protein
MSLAMSKSRVASAFDWNGVLALTNIRVDAG